MARVSVIILTHNSRRYLPECLVSLSGSSYHDFEVILVDTGSDDAGADLVERDFGFLPGLKVFRLSENLGYSRGNNFGARKSLGELLYFLNPDTRLDVESLAELVAALDEEKGLGVAQSLLLRGNSPNLIDCSGGFIDRFGWSHKRGYDTPFIPVGKGTETIFYAMGAALAIKRELFEALGGFDESMFLYHEDIDLCWRAMLSGKRVALVKGSVVLHYGSGSSQGQGDDDFVYDREKNHLITLYKNYSTKRLITSLPVVYFLYFLCFVYFTMIERKFVRGFAYLRSICWSLRNIPTLLEKRRRLRGNFRLQNERVEKLFLKDLVVLEILRRQWSNFLYHEK